ncbi:glycosyltransferase [Labilibaculum antarcticum]|uniref:Glycosyltransferase 2-like domain-containing protein n=1 Tax=Labilibaculum antarcticum TaxID=1717717 RepID=A0A1Y1CE67_9BACT|nr:glycosyltransferase [Labilibaculum antarcticum]BAX78637.1 hypothetical protein ALGA_0242 [Labilibaculum antarcticum]
MICKLSFIIPMYNAELYIDNCIRSLEKQDLLIEEYEIIIINDGSSDSSMGLVNQLQVEFSNIKLFSKKNGGASSARNLGLKKAKGEYIWYIDSDDTVLPNILSEILNISIFNNLDVLSFGVNSIKNGEEKKGNLENKPLGIVSGLEYIKDYDVEHSPCFFIIKRKLCIEKMIYFIEGITQEDYEFTLKLYSYCNRIMHFKKALYNYMLRSGSVSRPTNYSDLYKNIFSLISILQILKEQFPLNKKCKNFSYYANEWINAYKYLVILNVLGFPLKLKDKLYFYSLFKDHEILKIGKMRIYTGKHRIVRSILTVPIVYKSAIYIIHRMKGSIN